MCPQLTRAREKIRSLHDGMESLRQEKSRVAKALEAASTARFALLPRLRDAQVTEHTHAHGGREMHIVRIHMVQFMQIIFREKQQAGLFVLYSTHRSSLQIKS